MYGHALLAKGCLGITMQIVVDCYLTASHLNSDEISWNLMRPMSRVAWSMGVCMEVPSQSHDMTVQMMYTQKKHHIPARGTTSKADVWSGGR